MGGGRFAVTLQQPAQRFNALRLCDICSRDQQREVLCENFLRVDDVTRIGADLLDKSFYLVQAQQYRGAVTHLR